MENKNVHAPVTIHFIFMEKKQSAQLEMCFMEDKNNNNMR